jgi:hypothetical protein
MIVSFRYTCQIRDLTLIKSSQPHQEYLIQIVIFDIPSEIMTRSVVQANVAPLAKDSVINKRCCIDNVYCQLYLLCNYHSRLQHPCIR